MSVAGTYDPSPLSQTGSVEGHLGLRMETGGGLRRGERCDGIIGVVRSKFGRAASGVAGVGQLPRKPHPNSAQRAYALCSRPDN